MYNPKPTSPIPIYEGKIDLPKMFVDGKEVPYNCKIVRGEADVNTMTFRKYSRKNESEDNL